MPVMVVGSIALDTIRLPNGREYKDVPGGSCSYFIHSASFFAPVRVVGAVGGDFPKKYLDGFRKRKADLEGLQIRRGEKTFQWHGTYMADMNDRVTDALHFGVLGSFDPIVPPKFRKTSHVFLACSQPQLQARVLDQMEGSPFAVCDTIAIYIQENRAELDKLVKRCQGMIINDQEARMLSGGHNLVAAAAGLRRKYRLRFLVVKKGEHGGLLAVKDAVVPFPAYPLEKVSDPTGAGDCFAGGFVATLARLGAADLGSLKTAAVNATAVASYACQGLALAGLTRITAGDVRARAAEFAKAARLG
ncbi:MAG: PfkB family carbohydrate kinase [Planctomycetota bacterium]|nr:PfkB family carbohydrate kinase [Planctomycetota bacterium]